MFVRGAGPMGAGPIYGGRAYGGRAYGGCSSSTQHKVGLAIRIRYLGQQDLPALEAISP